ncbi:hypothetical protein EV424DRAFT_1371499 [Suillus variegatus]|nr:hypothetical protein EV424DRAFT_1439109 [Suillus variegatus]KAG1831528.1 hypothetical protein EV424DRAFT_1371499 [Suillus variegatus]
MLMFEDNTIRLELPLKYPETIRVTFIPDVPGPLTIEIVPSTCTTTKSPETPKEKHPNSRTFIGPAIDDSPAKPSISKNPVGEVISRPSTTHIANFPALNTDDSVTEPESEVEQGAPDVADKVGRCLLTSGC